MAEIVDVFVDFFIKSKNGTERARVLVYFCIDMQNVYFCIDMQKFS